MTSPQSVLVYSSCHGITNPDVLDSILIKSRRNNVSGGITGCLVVGQSHFLQMLEGDRCHLGACFLRIIQDCRHSVIQVISAHETDHRLFGEWTMHRVDIPQTRPEALSRHFAARQFDPQQMSQAMIDDLFRTLADREQRGVISVMPMDERGPPDRSRRYLR